MEGKITYVTPENIYEHPQAICFINPRNSFFKKKVEWFAREYKKGLRICLLYLPGEKKASGFVEFVPGEYCWRAVNAAGYMFIHCIWTTGKKIQHQGLGKMLINEVEKAAEGMAGVAVMTSDNAFMAKMEIFLKNGYMLTGVEGKDQLLVKQFRKGPMPSFNISTVVPGNNEGLKVLYSKQCPWVARFIDEAAAELEKLNAGVSELTTPEEAQKAPAPYGVFNMLYNGKILTDRYISVTRFRNIISKEKLKAK
jgi:hypothetical protein